MFKSRFAVLPLFIFCAGLAHSESLPPKLQKIAEFVKKKNACVFAVAEVPADEKLFANADSPSWQQQLLCVQDLTSKAGTINESKGCGLAWYNSQTDNYEPVQTMDSFGRAELEIVKGKPCAAGGFDELMKRKLGMYRATSVVGKLTRATVPKSNLAIVISASDAFRTSVEKAKVAAEVEAKARQPATNTKKKHKKHSRAQSEDESDAK